MSANKSTTTNHSNKLNQTHHDVINPLESKPKIKTQLYHHSNQNSNNWSWYNSSTTSSNTQQQQQQPSTSPNNPIHLLDPTASTTDSSLQPQSYVSQIGNWAYSYLARTPSSHPIPPNSTATPNLTDSLPNPILNSISPNSQGWASYFSSRGSSPIHSLKTDNNKSAQPISPKADSPQSCHSLTLPETPSPTTIQHSARDRPQSLMDIPKRWMGIKNHIPTSSSDDPTPNVTSSNQPCQTQNTPPPDPSSSSSHISTTSHNRPTKSEHNYNPTIAPMTDDLSPQTVNQIIKGKRVIPNLVLPTFEDTFYHPPRSFLPRPSKLQKTLGLVQALIYSNPAKPQFPQTVSNESSMQSSTRALKRRRVLEILEDNQHVSTKLPKCLDLLGINRIERLERIKKVAIIGVHGWFPGPWLESVLGKPTGTSNKFTSMMDKSLRKYVEKELGEKELNQDFTRIINLEGEGKVDDRVENFFNQLVNNRKDCLDFIKSADAIFVVSHSQGCLVSCKLVDKLINSFHLIGSKILSLSMCGIWNGPYIGLNNNYALQPVLKFFEGPAAHELFEFQNPHSLASKAVMKSLKNTLRLGVKYVLIGSMNDQVVPIYSSINNLIDHPSILRSIFIDSAVYYSSTDFLTNLVVFCVRLRNAGFSDHGLLFLLSDYLVGSLTGVGHSTIYEDQKVFDLAARYFFETSTSLEPPTFEATRQKKGTEERAKDSEEEGGNSDSESTGVIPAGYCLPDSLSNVDQSLNPREKPNPFLLTWSLRGLIEDHKIKLLFHRELMFLKDSFLLWNPGSTVSANGTATIDNNNSTNTKSNGSHPPPPSNSKILKDLKVKLEPFREVRLIDNPSFDFFHGSSLKKPSGFSFFSKL